MPLNIEFCLWEKIEMKHNPVASVLLPSSSRQTGFKKNKNKTKPEMAESKAECEGELELFWLIAEAGRERKHWNWRPKEGFLVFWTALEI